MFLSSQYNNVMEIHTHVKGMLEVKQETKLTISNPFFAWCQSDNSDIMI